MTKPGATKWLTAPVFGIIAATFFSDVGHELVTAVLPVYLASVGLGATALGVTEGVADLLYSFSKLAGGWLGHRIEKKRPIGALGYLVTTLGTTSLAFVHTIAALASLRSIAWIGRGVRAPLRDFMLSDAVPPTHFGRVYGVERTADMMGALVGPLLALLLVALGVPLRTVILVSAVPSLLAAASFFFFTRDRVAPPGDPAKPAAKPSAKLPPAFYRYVGGVLLFGLGDFSRAFLILLVARALAARGIEHAGSSISIAVLLYCVHNGVSALAAYPAGKLGDARPKLDVLLGGYVIGALTNALLAWGSDSLPVLVAATVLSGIYIAVEETIEKAAAADLLPREQRSLGFGVLASANAIGDMVSSVTVGFLIDAGRSRLAFGLASAAGVLGVLWLAFLARTRPHSGTMR